MIYNSSICNCLDIHWFVIPRFIYKPSVRSYLRDEHLEGKTWLYYPFCCCPQYRHNRRHQDTDMALLRLLLPVSSLLLILSLRLVKFPHRYIYIWNPVYFFKLILIIFQRSQRPKPFGVPDLFFQPLDNSNWTMLDLRWDSNSFQRISVIISRGLFSFQKDFTFK